MYVTMRTMSHAKNTEMRNDLISAFLFAETSTRRYADPKYFNLLSVRNSRHRPADESMCEMCMGTDLNCFFFTGRMVYQE